MNSAKLHRCRLARFEFYASSQRIRSYSWIVRHNNVVGTGYLHIATQLKLRRSSGCCIKTVYLLPHLAAHTRICARVRVLSWMQSRIRINCGFASHHWRTVWWQGKTRRHRKCRGRKAAPGIELTIGWRRPIFTNCHFEFWISFAGHGIEATFLPNSRNEQGVSVAPEACMMDGFCLASLLSCMWT
jgi:hypothetical protein